MLSNNSYFEVMKETSAEADKLIRTRLDGIVDVTRTLPESRLGKPRLRDLLVRLGYELSGGKNWKKIIPICASYELLNCSSYVINWIFDEKGGHREKNEINDLIIGGFQLREVAELLLRENSLEDVVGSVSRINEAIYVGQNLDLNVLRVRYLTKFRVFGNFVHVYRQRCHGLSGEFYGQCLLSGSKISGKEMTALYGVGEILGSALQASNDLGDFALPNKAIAVSEKPYKDQLSDLKKGKLTLPIYFLITKSGMEYEDLTTKTPEEIVGLLFSTGSFQECYDYLQNERKKAKVRLHKSFEKSYARDMLSSALIIISYNKFITNLKSAQKK